VKDQKWNIVCIICGIIIMSVGLALFVSELIRCMPTYHQYDYCPQLKEPN